MIRINVKKGVVFKVIGYEFCTLARIVYRVLERRGIVPTVTSANDGKHLPDSWHYQDLGWDWRIWGVAAGPDGPLARRDDSITPIDEVKLAADEIRKELQAIDYRYDVIYGDKDHLDHIHTEYDLKKVK